MISPRLEEIDGDTSSENRESKNDLLNAWNKLG